MIDSHCHLLFDYSPKTIEELIHSARQQGVLAFLNVGTKPEEIPQLEEISDRFDGVYHSVGLHPHEAKDWKNELTGTFKHALAHPKCRAIGEIGLDYHYHHSTPEQQLAALEDQLDFAAGARLPVIIHSREAEADLLRCLKVYSEKSATPGGPGVIHCFTGTAEFAKACLEMGFLISFSGIITFTNAEPLRDVLRKTPLDRMLIETDSPFLAPVPFRGKKCEPEMVRWVANKVAEIKSIDLSVVMEQTTQNFNKLFKVSA